jgi:hypothetical protein
MRKFFDIPDPKKDASYSQTRVYLSRINVQLGEKSLQEEALCRYFWYWVEIKEAQYHDRGNSSCAFIEYKNPENARDVVLFFRSSKPPHEYKRHPLLQGSLHTHYDIFVDHARDENKWKSRSENKFETGQQIHAAKRSRISGPPQISNPTPRQTEIQSKEDTLSEKELLPEKEDMLPEKKERSNPRFRQTEIDSEEEDTLMDK